jgi:hypothetical protein
MQITVQLGIAKEWVTVGEALYCSSYPLQPSFKELNRAYVTRHCALCHSFTNAGNKVGCRFSSTLRTSGRVGGVIFQVARSENLHPWETGKQFHTLILNIISNSGHHTSGLELPWLWFIFLQADKKKCIYFLPKTIRRYTQYTWIAGV